METWGQEPSMTQVAILLTLQMPRLELPPSHERYLGYGIHVGHEGPSVLAVGAGEYTGGEDAGDPPNADCAVIVEVHVHVPLKGGGMGCG